MNQQEISIPDAVIPGTAKTKKSKDKLPTLKASRNKKWEDLMRLHLNLHGLGHLFVDQYRIEETGRQWRYDFADPVNKVCIEIQGGIWGGKSAHNSGVGISRDHEKSNAAQYFGFRVFSFSEKPIKSGEAIQFLVKFYRYQLGV